MYGITCPKPIIPGTTVRCTILVSRPVHKDTTIVIELSKHFRYDIIVSFSNDIIESFDTISNPNSDPLMRTIHKNQPTRNST